MHENKQRMGTFNIVTWSHLTINNAFQNDVAMALMVVSLYLRVDIVHLVTNMDRNFFFFIQRT